MAICNADQLLAVIAAVNNIDPSVVVCYADSFTRRKPQATAGLMGGERGEMIDGGNITCH